MRKISLEWWFNDLTYAEVHSFTWGLIFTFFSWVSIALLSEPLSLWIATLLYGTFITLLARAWVKTDVSVLPDKVVLNVPKFVYEQIRKELHYYGSGGVAGTLLGIAVYMMSVIYNIPTIF